MSDRGETMPPQGSGTPAMSVEQEILRAVRAIRFGSVEVVIHDSRVVQIERKEKVRFEPNRSGSDKKQS